MSEPEPTWRFVLFLFICAVTGGVALWHARNLATLCRRPREERRREAKSGAATVRSIWAKVARAWRRPL